MILNLRNRCYIFFQIILYKRGLGGEFEPVTKMVSLRGKLVTCVLNQSEIKNFNNRDCKFISEHF